MDFAGFGLADCNPKVAVGGSPAAEAATAEALSVFAFLRFFLRFWGREWGCGVSGLGLDSGWVWRG